MEIERGEVKVYVWNAGSKREAVESDETGHAALHVRTLDDDAIYLSWYPTGKNLWIPQPSRMPLGYGRSKTDYDPFHADGPQRVFSDKVLNAPGPLPPRGQGIDDMAVGSADKKAYFLLEALDTRAVYDFAVGLTQGSETTSFFAWSKQYNVAFQNCSSTVAHALRRGIEAKYPDATHPVWPGHLVWTPALAWNYTSELVEFLIRQNKAATFDKQKWLGSLPSRTD